MHAVYHSVMFPPTLGLRSIQEIPAFGPKISVPRVGAIVFDSFY